MTAEHLTAEQLHRLGDIVQHLQRRRRALGAAPSIAIPGSEEKIAILADRVAAGAPLWNADDPPMPIGIGWDILVEPNGRVVYKRLVYIATGELVETHEKKLPVRSAREDHYYG